MKLFSIFFILALVQKISSHPSVSISKIQKFEKFPQTQSFSSIAVPTSTKYQNLDFTLKSYLAPKSNIQYTETPFLWQTNINYIQPIELRNYVEKVVVSQPMATWPYVIRKLVFPRIYGFCESPLLKQEVLRLVNGKKIEEESDGEKKVELLEKLMKLEDLKKQVEKNLIEQTEKLLVARKYYEKVRKLEHSLNAQIDRFSKVDDMLQNIAPQSQ